MKKIYILIIAILIGNFANAQNYLINFSGSGAANTVGNVKVDNLTQNTSLTLNGNDTLHLGAVGINETEFNSNSPLIYPNPMQGKAELTLYAEQAENIQIRIVDITGKEILRMGNNYPKGILKFQLNGLKQGMYFVNIKSETYSYSLKLISQNSNQNETAAIEYSGYENETPGKLKNTNTTVNMAYNNGDRLLFKGTSGNYSNIITDIPASSKTITFNFAACTDFDNNNYASVQIGTQTWMAENLKTTHYKNGTPIPNVIDSVAWAGLNTGARCYYNNDSASYASTYGALYNWYTVNTGNLCPIGWHVPSDAEWTTLTTYLGGESVAGGKLKATTLWSSPNTGATNSSGFTALPGGLRTYPGTYGNFGFGYWWSSTESNTADAWYRGMGYGSGTVGRHSYHKNDGYSVRCLRD